MHINVKCPFCGGNCQVRTSDKPSLLTVKAQVYCPNCGGLRADFMGQLTNIKRAIYIDCPEAGKWEKPEKQLIKEQGKTPITNEMRLEHLRRGEAQPDLFSQPPKKTLTPAKRLARREKICN
ncbi:transcriptional regulator [Gallibacterium anatis]|uniref:transcriptional regulator n=1 Tax=Gallibacterium anatis TaxID=750 RepID=UPI003005C923